VTRPDAPLVFPDPGHRIVKFPNAIAPEDFAGFRLDRGAFFPVLTDADAFEVPILAGEPGGEPHPAVVLTAHGKGVFAYTALSWPRHLDDLNPGSLRLLGNLVSYLWRR
jgi:hypothetical protein